MWKHLLVLLLKHISWVYARLHGFIRIELPFESQLLLVSRHRCKCMSVTHVVPTWGGAHTKIVRFLLNLSLWLAILFTINMSHLRVSHSDLFLLGPSSNYDLSISICASPFVPVCLSVSTPASAVGHIDVLWAEDSGSLPYLVLRKHVFETIGVLWHTWRNLQGGSSTLLKWWARNWLRHRVPILRVFVSNHSSKKLLWLDLFRALDSIIKPTNFLKGVIINFDIWFETLVIVDILLKTWTLRQKLISLDVILVVSLLSRRARFVIGHLVKLV